jgi:hypothetical protein
MASTLTNKTMCIMKVLFDLPGKITLKMEDGRMIISPLKYFPDLQKLSVDKRKKHTIVDDTMSNVSIKWTKKGLN